MIDKIRREKRYRVTIEEISTNDESINALNLNTTIEKICLIPSTNSNKAPI
ncbi:hypothetical protein JCM19238_3611 [Vibrio ponticus]|nr:hypothetical protein JCM19238_3611 [Vibrio ponticus]